MKQAPGLIERSNQIKAQARACGFELAGIARPEVTEAYWDRLESWCEQGKNGSMDWFVRTKALRRAPLDYMPEAKSVLVLGSLYRSAEMDQALQKARRKIARYAGGRDYHKVLKKKARRLLQAMKALYPEIMARICVDTSPVAEKELARLSGLGWQGKNTNIIHPELGSYFFLVAIFLNIELAEDRPGTDGCGGCRKCLDACPTKALEPYLLDARRCISYQTIENKSRTDYPGSGSGWIFGCDICQEVCPYNAKAKSYFTFQEFAFRPALLPLLAGNIPDEDAWESIATGSPLRRAGLEKIRASLEASAGF